ncbi:SSI family serine proteinase inhibitor [Streptomyces xanthophaeus]
MPLPRSRPLQPVWLPGSHFSPEGSHSGCPEPCKPGSVTRRRSSVSGTHPAPEAACKLLQAAGGVMSNLSGGERKCGKEYIPVTVTAAGVLGRPAGEVRGHLRQPV